MRYLLALLSGLLGALAGWVALAALVISLAGPDRDGGIAMGAFFQIGPIGGVLGFIAGVALFLGIGIVHTPQAPSDTTPSTASAPPPSTRISRPFAIVTVAIVAGLAYQGWYEFIRSPYLSRGFMTLALQFKLPPNTPLPTDVADVHISAREAGRQAEILIGRAWHGHLGNQQVILASTDLSLKTRTRAVSLELPGLPRQTWILDLSTDPAPTDGFTAFTPPSNGALPAVEMNYRLTADNPQ